MQRFALIFCLLAAFVLWGCGGKKKTTTNPPAKVTVDISSISLNFGEIFTLSSGAVHVVDASGNVLTNGPSFSISSSNTSLVTINSANNSEICGGIFNSNATVCSGKDANGNFLPTGTANITVSAQGVNSDPIPVSVHPRVTSAAVVAPTNACISQNQVLEYKVVACSAGTAPSCTGGSDISNQLGTPTWSTSDTNIASVDSTGTVTSKLPGAVTVSAALGNVNIVNPTPALFVACPPRKISIHVTGAADTTFPLDPNASTPVTSVKLDADVVDTAGQPITGANLTWSSYTPASASVASDGTVTAVAAGITSIVASCTPPSCNNAPPLSPSAINAGAGLPVYSNLAIGSVAGTSAPAIYTTGATLTDGTTPNTTLLVIDPANPGSPTSVTLPHPPNSLVLDRQGAKAYLSSSDGSGLMVFDTSSNTVTTTVAGITGTVVAVSRDGSRVVVSDTTSSVSKVFVYNTTATSNNIETFSLAGVTGADFAGDNSKGLFASPTAGNSLFYVPGGGSRAIQSSVGNDVKFLPQGSVAYFASDSGITGVASCSTPNQIRPVDTSKPNAVKVWGVATDGSHLIGAGSTWVDLAPSITPPPATPPTPTCPPTVSSTVRTATLPAFVGTPTQIAVTPDSKKSFITGFTLAQGATTSGLPAFDVTSGTASVISGIPSGAQVFSGGITLDGRSLYVGAGGTTPAVYGVDLTVGSPAAAPLAIPSTSLTFIPNFVAVRPK